MRVDLLGPLEIADVDPNAPLPPGALMSKERAVLETLALRAPGTVPRVDLERALWGECPPPTARKTLATHVSRLRRALGEDVIAGGNGGYRLALPRESVDVHLLESLVAAGADALDREAPAQARERFGAAESLWRGEPLADVADSVERQAQVERLHRLVEEARAGRLRAELALGRHTEVLPELQRLVAQDALAEQVCGLLMLALYRTGRQVEALRAFHRLRAGLAEEWGVDPSPDLQRLEWQILRQDPQLDLHPPEPPLVAPAPWASIIGRDAEVAAVSAAVHRDRLVTLRGPAGVGKSRLALEVARTSHPGFADGAWWVDLTVTETGPAALAEVARTLGVAAAPAGSLDDALASHLARRQLLLVLDNCEHVVADVAPLVVALLQASPALSVLATSRVELGVPGEAVHQVPPLPTPQAAPDDAALDDSALLDAAATPAVQLFLARRGGPEPDRAELGEIARLCRTLDGLPLALELVAAQARRVSVSTLNQRLSGDRPDVGTQADPPAGLLDATFRAARTGHHLNLRRAVDWSFQTLAAPDQRAYAWLSVLPGAFEQATAEGLLRAMDDEGIADPSTCLARLAEASLLEADPPGSTRYRLLFVMREHAGAQLAATGEFEAAHQALADTMRALAVEAGPHLDGARPGPWLRRLQSELPALRAAVRWSMEHEPPARTLEFAHSVGRIMWSASVDLRTDAELLRGLVERAPDAPADVAAWGWQELVTASYLAGDLPLALHACDRAEDLFTQAGDRVGLAVTCWHRGAALMLAAGDLPAAETTLRRGITLARQSGAATPEAWNTTHVVQLLYLRGDLTREIDTLMARAEALADPEDGQLQGHLAMNRGFVAVLRGDLARGAELCRRSAETGRRFGIPVFEQAGLLGLGHAQLRSHEREAARATSLRAAQVALDTGNEMQLGLALQLLAALSEDPAVAARLWGAAQARAPQFPAFTANLDIGWARDALGGRFAPLAASGHDLSPRAAMALAVA